MAVGEFESTCPNCGSEDTVCINVVHDLYQCWECDEIYEAVDDRPQQRGPQRMRVDED